MPQKYSGSKTSKPLKNKTTKMELWKSFPDKKLKITYEISNKGRLRNKNTGRIIKLNMKLGYYYCNLPINGKVKGLRIHRLVAKLFVKNPDAVKNNIVNHIDGNKLNNDYQNLEWTTTGGNNQHAADHKLTGVTKRRVGQYVGKELYEEYDSLSAAHEATGIHMSQIVEACKGKHEEYGGFVWKYLDDNPNEQIIDPEKNGFKNIKTFPNYWINDNGQIYSKPFKKFMKLNKHRTGCLQIQLTKRDPKGKGQIKKTILVHNLVAMYFLKKTTNNKFNSIRHKDGDKTNNNVKNLEWNYVAGIKPNFDI
jgi:hypothetical protein